MNCYLLLSTDLLIFFFQSIKSHLQALGDETIPLELAMEPFSTYAEGRIAIQELTSTQTIISSLINNSSDQSKTEAMKELTINAKRFEQILLESDNNDNDGFVSLKYKPI